MLATKSLIASILIIRKYNMIIRPHRVDRIHAACCYMSHVSWSVCVSTEHTGELCKTAEPKEMPFRRGQTHVGPLNHNINKTCSIRSLNTSSFTHWYPKTSAAFR